MVLWLVTLLEIEPTTPSHVPSRENTGADVISRDKSALFLSLYPHANQIATPLPPAMLQLAVSSTQDWTARTWKQLLVATLNKVYKAQSTERSYKFCYAS